MMTSNVSKNGWKSVCACGKHHQGAGIQRIYSPYSCLIEKAWIFSPGIEDDALGME